VIGTSGFIIVTSMVADLVEEMELRTGRRSEGLLLAAETFLRKLSTGVTVIVPGLLLALVGFPPHADPKTLDPLVMRHLALISMPLRVVLGIAATSVLLLYRIDRGTHEANLATLSGDVGTKGDDPDLPIRAIAVNPGNAASCETNADVDVENAGRVPESARMTRRSS